MIQVLQSIGQAIVSFIGVITHAISTLVSFLGLIPRFVGQILIFVTYLPSWLVAFVVCAVMILVVKLIIGR